MVNEFGCSWILATFGFVQQWLIHNVGFSSKFEIRNIKQTSV
jgi:hypothetical protein